MPEPSAQAFGELLRELRVDAGLTQEELAAAASLSPRSISDLERGINLTARRETARLLADALRLSGDARAEFEAVARGRLALAQRVAVQAASGAAATRTLPRDAGSFTGRERELRQLVGAAAGAARAGGVVGIHAIGGMAGVGKTTFAVHAAHKIAGTFPDGQVFLRLHAHTPGQQPVRPADALASLLLTAGIAASQIPPGLEDRSRLWRDHLAGKRMLLIFDDAAGHEQIRPLLPGTAGSLVLVTSRRHLTALEDAEAISLDTLTEDEAAALLIRLAARPALGAAARDIRQIVRLCGCLPLAIGMLARQLHHHPAWTAADLGADLAEARDRLELLHAENVSVGAAFDLSYADLDPAQQRLFRSLGVHPGADIDVYAAACLADIDLGSARRDLNGLYDHYLLTEPVRGRYRLHDLLREHARSLATNDPAEARQSAAGRLLRYYLTGAQEADSHLTRRTPVTRERAARRPVLVPDFTSRAAAIGWLEAERMNLHAAASYAASEGLWTFAIAIPAAMHSLLRGKGYWEQALALERMALDAARQADSQEAEAGALTDLGDLQYAMRDYPEADASLRSAVQIYQRLGNELGEAHALTERATVLHLTGDNVAASASLDRALRLYRHVGDRRGEASALRRLGNVQLVTGDYESAAAGLGTALELCRQIGDSLGEAHALHDLGAVQQSAGDFAAAIDSHERALALYRELGDSRGEANALSDLGSATQATGDLAGATGFLDQALDLYRKLGDRLGQADALSQLGDIATAEADRSGARASYEQAREIAAGIAAAFVEARALEGIGRILLDDGDSGAGVAALRQALAIYQRIGSPAADRVAATLGGQGG